MSERFVTENPCDTMQSAYLAGDSLSTVRASFEASLAQFCAAVPTPHAVFDEADDALVLANPPFVAEFGAVPASRKAFERDFEPVSIESDSPARSGGVDTAHRVEVFCPRRGRWYVFHWSRLFAPHGGILVMLSAQNLTERMDTMRQQRALEEQLLSSSRAMSVGEMTTTLAHEINQPLATILNCLTAGRMLLGQRGARAQRVRQALDLAYEQAEQAAAVIARLREFVRKREPHRESQSLKTLVDHVVQLQQLDAQKHRVRIAVELEPHLPRVLVDRVMVEQVLTNLVRNGIEAMYLTHPAERMLTIAARLDMDGRVEVRVLDRGPGVSAGEEAQLFTPFFTTKPNGMGIGLAICRSIIEFHEGHLCFERHAPGGSAFTFTLPPVPSS